MIAIAKTTHTIFKHLIPNVFNAIPFILKIILTRSATVLIATNANKSITSSSLKIFTSEILDSTEDEKEISPIKTSTIEVKMLKIVI